MSTVSYIIWTDIVPEREVAFNEWYNREHAPDRVLGIQGFIQARRFVAADGGPKYAAWFDVAGPEVFRDEAYMTIRRTPDPRSQEFIPLFRNTIRFIGSPAADVVAVKGVAEGAWVRFAVWDAPLDDAGVPRWSGLLQSLVAQPGIVRARVFTAEPELLASAVRNMQGAARERLRGPDRLGGALLMIEGTTETALAEIEPEVLGALASCPGVMLGSARMRQMMRVAKP